MVYYGFHVEDFYKFVERLCTVLLRSRRVFYVSTRIYPKEIFDGILEMKFLKRGPSSRVGNF